MGDRHMHIDLSEFAYALFASVLVITLGWSPNCTVRCKPGGGVTVGPAQTAAEE
jgi:hypothetical protein